MRRLCRVSRKRTSPNTQAGKCRTPWGKSPVWECRPSVGFTLRSPDGNRVLRRSIEQSEILPNGLFITNHIFVSLPDLTELDQERSWIGQINKIANRASGIAYQEDKSSDDSGT